MTVLRLAAATTHSFEVVALDPSGNASAGALRCWPRRLRARTRPARRRRASLYAFDFGCETWLFWEESMDDVDAQDAILAEVCVNGVFDGALVGIDRWITYGTAATNTSSRRSTP